MFDLTYTLIITFMKIETSGMQNFINIVPTCTVSQG